MSSETGISEERRQGWQAAHTSQVQECILKILDDHRSSLVSFSELRERVAQANIFIGEVGSNKFAYHVKKCLEKGWITHPEEMHPEPAGITNTRGRMRYSYYGITEKGRLILLNSSNGPSNEIIERLDEFKRRILVRLLETEGEDSPAEVPLENFTDNLKNLLNPRNDPKNVVESMCQAAEEWRFAKPGRNGPGELDSLITLLKKSEERVQTAMVNMRLAFLKYMTPVDLNNEAIVDGIRAEFDKLTDTLQKIVDPNSTFSLADGEFALGSIMQFLFNLMRIAPKAAASVLIGFPHLSAASQQAGGDRKQYIQILKKEEDAINKMKPEKR